MSTDRADEYSKFVPEKLHYEIIPPDKQREHYQQQEATAIIFGGEEPERTGTRRGIFNQILVTCAVLVLAAGCGMPIGYSTTLLPQLLMEHYSNDTTAIFMDAERGSWIASVHSLATPLGALLSGPLADYMGRRGALLFSILPFFIGWPMLATAKSYVMLIIGRMICGFATGILGGPAQVYIAETAEPNLRSLLICAPFVSYSSGIMIVYALGVELNWRTVAWLGLVLPALAGLAIFFIPESPAWLVRNNKLARAHKAMKFLRGDEIVAQKEIRELSERLRQERATTKSNENIFQLICQREAMKPLFIVIVFVFLQMCTGTFILVYYATDIILDLDLKLNGAMVGIWIAVSRLIFTIICCGVLLVVRRRLMIVISGIGCGLSCAILSVFMYMNGSQAKGDTYMMVVLSCILIYVAFNTVLMVMPGIMVGELFPAKIRGRTAGAIFAAMNVALFGYSKIFPAMQQAMRMRGVFIIFAVSSFLAAIFMFMFQPETKGRTLEQIEDYFKERNWLWFKRDKSYKEVKSGVGVVKA